MGLFGAAAIQPKEDRFVSRSVGNTLILKACGFIESQNARVLDVSESMLRLRTGCSWMTWLLTNAPMRKQMEISLNILPVCDDASTGPQAGPVRTLSSIDVRIRPISLTWTHAEFEDESRRMLWLLRSHFMAC